MTQVIYLAFLAPDIVQRLAQGAPPADLGTKKLPSMMPPPPLDRGGQIQVLAFDR